MLAASALAAAAASGKACGGQQGQAQPAYVVETAAAAAVFRDVRDKSGLLRMYRELSVKVSQPRLLCAPSVSLCTVSLTG